MSNVYSNAEVLEEIDYINTQFWKYGLIEGMFALEYYLMKLRKVNDDAV